MDHRADIYSLGVVIYEMLTGELPLGRFPAPSQRAAVSARIDEIVFRTLEKERELRQQSAAEVKTDVQGMGKTAMVAPQTPGSKRGFGKVVAGLAALILLSALGVFIHYSRLVKPGIAQANYDYQWSEATSSDADRLILEWKLALSEMDKPGRNHALGPVVEVVLPEPSADAPFMLNFENGNLFTPNPELGKQLKAGGSSYLSPTSMEEWSNLTKSNYSWLQIQRVNALAIMPDCDSIQFFATFPFLLDCRFEDADSDRILRTIRQGMDTNQPWQTLSRHFKERSFIPLHSQPGQSFTFIAPAAFGATTGIVEVLGKSAPPQRGVKIRYRLVKRLPDTPAPQPVAPPKQSAKSGSDWDIDQTSLAKPIKVDEDHDFAPWAEYIKDGDMRRAHGDLAAALRSYQAGLAYVEKAQAEQPGSWLDVQPEWCRSRIGDVQSLQGDLRNALQTYRGSQELLIKRLEEAPGDAGIRDELTRVCVKMGDVQLAAGDRPGATRSYRDGVAVAEKFPKNWETEYPLGSSGHELARNYQAKEVLRLIDTPDRYSWDLMWMIGQAGADKDVLLRPLLERKDLRQDATLALALAGYDYSLNGNRSGLDFILAELSKRDVGADVNEVVVLSFVDEWDRSTKAVDSHFLATDGAGGDCMNAFWARRMLLFPRRYLEFKGKAGEGAPVAAAGKSEESKQPEVDGAQVGDAMKAVLKAARERNARVFQNGFSKSFKATLKEEGQSLENFGDFGQSNFISANKLDAANAEVVIEANDGSRRRFTFRMIVEDGEWKLNELGSKP